VKETATETETEKDAAIKKTATGTGPESPALARAHQTACVPETGALVLALQTGLIDLTAATATRGLHPRHRRESDIDPRAMTIERGKSKERRFSIL
jgi:hypothetical protein